MCKFINKILCKLGFHKPYTIYGSSVYTVCENCLNTIIKENGRWKIDKNTYWENRNKQLLEYYNKVKYAFSPEVKYDDDLSKEDLDKIFNEFRNGKYEYLSVYERELFEKIFLVHFLEELEKAGIIKVLR